MMQGVGTDGMQKAECTLRILLLRIVEEPSGAAAPNRFPRGEAVERSETEEEFGR